MQSHPATQVRMRGGHASPGGSGGRSCSGPAFPPTKAKFGREQSPLGSVEPLGGTTRSWGYMARCPPCASPRDRVNPSDLSPAVCVHLHLPRSGVWDSCECGSGPHWSSSLQP